MSLHPRSRLGLIRRIDDSRLDLAFVLLASVTVPALVYLGRSLTFWQDEWTFIASDTSSPLAYLAPHNEHWSTVPRLLYAALLAVVGLRSYLPYLALLATLHVLAAGGIYVLLVRRLPRPAALSLMLPVLVLGAGSENLLWAFQIGFVASVATGAWGLVALESRHRRAPLVGTLLLVASLASSGIGLVLLVVAAVRLAADPGRRRRLAWLALPVLLYALWFLAFGRAGLTARDTLAPASAIASFMARGLLYAVSRSAGLDLVGARAGSALAALLLLVAVAGGVAIARIRGAAPALALGAFVGLVGLYALLALSRATLAADFAERGRYVYVAAFLMVLIAGDLAAAWLPVSRLSSLVLAGLASVLLLALVANVRDLRAGQATFLAHADATRGYLVVLEAHPDAAWLDPGGRLPDMPEVPRLLQLLALRGWPTADQIVPSVVRQPSRAALDAGLVLLARSGFYVDSAGPAGGTPVLPVALAVTDARLSWGSGCVEVEPQGARPAVTLQVPDGGAMTLTGSGQEASAALGHDAPPATRSRIPLRLAPGTSPTIRVPDLGDGSNWRVRIALPAQDGTVTACVRGP